jgi:hypothetical protein
MDPELFCNTKVTPETPSILSDDLISHFNLQKIYKDYKKKKQNRALQTSLKEIISIEKNLKVPEFSLTQSEKNQLFS